MIENHVTTVNGISSSPSTSLASSEIITHSCPSGPSSLNWFSFLIIPKASSPLTTSVILKSRTASKTLSSSSYRFSYIETHSPTGTGLLLFPYSDSFSEVSSSTSDSSTVSTSSISSTTTSSSLSTVSAPHATRAISDPANKTAFFHFIFISPSALRPLIYLF